jgi:5-hydroxyisourate hydrolase
MERAGIAMGRLTTHVLDTANGCPAANIRIDLFRPGQHDAIATTITNNDGRCEAPILEGEAFTPGEYELVFHAGAYFNALGQEDGERRFLDRVVVRFGISNPDQHYHVPLLLSPFGYSTYRGS